MLIKLVISDVTVANIRIELYRIARKLDIAEELLTS